MKLTIPALEAKARLRAALLPTPSTPISLYPEHVEGKSTRRTGPLCGGRCLKWRPRHSESDRQSPGRALGRHRQGRRLPHLPAVSLSALVAQSLPLEALIQWYTRSFGLKVEPLPV